MGKRTQKSREVDGRQVKLLTQEELQQICQKAVEDGVAKYITVQKQKKKEEWRIAMRKR